MIQKMFFNDIYCVFGVKMVDFGGWDMFIYYGLQLDEYYLVCVDVGMFDVSYMIVVDLCGVQVKLFLCCLLVNLVDKFKVIGKVLYLCMFNLQGGVIDDLIVYYLVDDFFCMVVNVFICEKDLVWICEQVVVFDVQVIECDDLVIIVVQGFIVCVCVIGLVVEGDCVVLNMFGCFVVIEVIVVSGVLLFVVCIGYIGEDGFEILILQNDVVVFWNVLVQVGVCLVGLGVCDMLCLEVGMNLYGQDMDEQIILYEVVLVWIVVLDEGCDFIGCEVLEVQKVVGDVCQLIGLVMDEKGVLCYGQVVFIVSGQGEILFGIFFLMLGKGIVFVCVLVGELGQVYVDICGKQVLVCVVKFLFVCEGQVQFGVLVEV